MIVNNTGGTLYLTLSGPAEYDFTIAPGNHTIWVVPGTYNYTGTGCGGARRTGIEVISNNTGNWDWWCS